MAKNKRKRTKALLISGTAVVGGFAAFGRQKDLSRHKESALIAKSLSYLTHPFNKRKRTKLKYSLFKSIIRGKQEKPLIYPIKDVIAAHQKRGIHDYFDLRAAGLHTRSATGNIPKVKQAQAFYGSGLGKKLSKAEKFGLQRKILKDAFRKGDIYEKSLIRSGVKVVAGSTRKQIKDGIRTAATAQRIYYAKRKVEVTIGKILPKSYVRKQRIKFINENRSLLNAFHRSPLGTVPFSNTNIIREASGYSETEKLLRPIKTIKNTKLVKNVSKISSKFIKGIKTSSTRLIKPATKLGKVGKFGLAAGAAISASVIAKKLLSKQEKSKRISVGLKKSAKFRNRKFKKR